MGLTGRGEGVDSEAPSSVHQGLPLPTEASPHDLGSELTSCCRLLWGCLTPPASRLPTGTRGYLEILPAALGKQGLKAGQWFLAPPPVSSTGYLPLRPLPGNWASSGLLS